MNGIHASPEKDVELFLCLRGEMARTLHQKWA
jgi:hypothetical protein